MKKKNIIRLSIILLIIIISIILIFKFFYQKNAIENEYKGTKDLTYIKNYIADDEYFIFEDEGQKYILFKITVWVYSPTTIKINSIKIINKAYTKNNELKLNVLIDTKTEKETLPDGICIDGTSSDSRFFILKVTKNCSGLIINSESYKKFEGSIVSKTEEITKNDKVYNVKKRGYINENGDFTIPQEYSAMYPLDDVYYDPIQKRNVNIDYNNYLKVEKWPGGYGIVSKDGTQILECKYDYLVNYDKDMFLVTINNNTKMAIIDINGNVIKGYVDAGAANRSYKIVPEYLIYELNGKKGVIDRNLNFITNAEFDDVNIETLTIYNNFGDMKEEYFGGDDGITYEEPYLIVKKDNKLAIIDFNGNIKMDYHDSSIYNIKEEYRKKVMEFLKK